jgi:shikimate dehydrogenase
VTAPFKQSLATQCHRLSAEASATGVVNTMTFEAHGMVVGHNTDVAGALGALRRAGTSQVPKASRNAFVLGTGGAARAGAYALLRLGYAVTMLGRTLEPARAFVAHHGIQLASRQAAVLDQLQPAVGIHATPVGSAHLDPRQRLLPDWKPAAGVTVLDMVYNPAETALLAAVRAAGGIPIPGLEMFLTQAAAQLELFCEQTLPESELRLFLAGAAAAQ